MEDTRIKLNEQELAYKKSLKWHMLSYQDIKQAYLSIEEARGKLCCGVALFETYYLMLKTVDEELLKIEVSICPLETSNCDVMLYSEFESAAALKAYAVHPDHVYVADNYVRPYTKERFCIDTQE